MESSGDVFAFLTSGARFDRNKYAKDLQQLKAVPSASQGVRLCLLIVAAHACIQHPSRRTLLPSHADVMCDMGSQAMTLRVVQVLQDQLRR